MKTILTARVLDNSKLKTNFYILKLHVDNGEVLKEILPGQFLNIYLPDKEHLVPRPFSILYASKNEVYVLYKVIGCGTKALSAVALNTQLKILIPLGNNFPLENEKNIYLAGGGVGIAPLYFYIKLLKELKPERLANTYLYYGASNADSLVMIEDINNLGCKVTYTTDDGSYGKKGNCIAPLISDIASNHRDSIILSCGPKRMMTILSEFAEKNNITAYLSLEEVMGCGFGACVGCVTRTKPVDNEIPYKLVCKDGPVFNSKELDMRNE